MAHHIASGKVLPDPSIDFMRKPRGFCTVRWCQSLRQRRFLRHAWRQPNQCIAPLPARTLFKGCRRYPRLTDNTALAANQSPDRRYSRLTDDYVPAACQSLGRLVSCLSDKTALAAHQSPDRLFSCPTDDFVPAAYQRTGLRGPSFIHQDTFKA